jgi:hypothetical protein
MAQGSPKKRRVGENIADWNNPEVVDALVSDHHISCHVARLPHSSSRLVLLKRVIEY